MDELETQPCRKLLDLNEILLPEGWKHTLPKDQHVWVSKALFRRDASGKLALTEPLQLWWYPPEPQSTYLQPPQSPDLFFQRKLFLWMPCRLWGYRLLCSKPNCRRLGNHLRPCGLFGTVRKVLDTSGWYFMGTEFLECCSCRRKVPGWSPDILDQLDPIHCHNFPAVLTYRLSCDRKLFGMGQRQTPWKSAVALHSHLCVQHKEQWMAQAAHYLNVMHKFQELSDVSIRVPEMMAVPHPLLLLAVYAKDALTRLGEMKARVTSVFGSILKMATTKKVIGKQGPAVWTTTIGNETRQVLMCVLTQTEDECLLPVCSGLTERYQRAGNTPPQVLYVSNDCCSTSGKGKIKSMFPEWDQLSVKLDPWEFMERFASGITSDRHPMYGTFMGHLFSCIFEWDAGDVKRLHEAKQQQTRKATCMPTAEELIQHCRHRTRGVGVTQQLIEQLLKDFAGATDFLGNQLFDQIRMQEIWRAQQQHLPCIQDPPRVQLYKKVKEVTKGGVILPKYSCARGLRSVQAFHEHLRRFIPGISQNDLHFQVYLVEAIVEWNKSQTAGVQQTTPLHRFANTLSQKLLGCKLVEDHSGSAEYTGELIGVEYLYSQTSRVLEMDDIMDPDVPDSNDDLLEVELDCEDSDFEDLRAPQFLEFSIKPPQHVQQQPTLLQTIPSGIQTSQTDPIVSSTSGSIKDEPIHEQLLPHSFLMEEEEEVKFIGSDGVLGHNNVANLANSLVELRNGFLSQRKVDEIVALWEKLSDNDKSAEDAETLCADGVNSQLITAICHALCHIHPVDQMVAGVRVSRWTTIIRDYSTIRDVMQNSAAISSLTGIQLLELNQRTLCQWYNSREQRQEQLVLHQWMNAMKAAEPLLPLTSCNTEAFHRGQAEDVVQVVIGLPNPSSAAPIHSEQNLLGTRPIYPKVSRTTAWRRRKADEEAIQQGLPLKRLSEQYLCKKCGNPKTKEFGHSQFGGVHFCAKTSGKTVEQWVKEMRSSK